MPNVSRPLRLLLVAVLALAVVALLWLLFGLLHSGLALWRELQAQPPWLQYAIIAVVLLCLGAIAWLGWRLMRPRRRAVPVAAPTRAQVEQRVSELERAQVDTAALQRELEELDRRARSEELYVAVFGEISAGKSSLIGALLPDVQPATDVLGGTTRQIALYHGAAPQIGTLTLADVPGTHEVGGSVREQLARDEALRAHLVLYVCAADLTRDQDAELRWLHGFGKPLVLVLNKADQFRDGERATLQRALRERYAGLSAAQVVISAGGQESFERVLADGRREQVRRARAADIDALRQLLARYAAHGAAAFEPAREAAVLSALSARADELAAQTRERAADAVVEKYTRRAVVGALAAVMPGTDLVIQGVLGAALIRELGQLYAVPLRDVDVDAFLGQVKLTLRTSASLVLAIAGNALKAFPGLGTLGGGVLHAIAYGLIFDSLGRAVAATLRDQRRLDGDKATAALSALLAQTGAERLRRIADYALNADGAARD